MYVNAFQTLQSALQSTSTMQLKSEGRGSRHGKSKAVAAASTSASSESAAAAEDSAFPLTTPSFLSPSEEALLKADKKAIYECVAIKRGRPNLVN